MPCYLVHLHAAEVRVAYHQGGTVRLVTVAKLHLHLAGTLKCLCVADGNRRGTAAGSFDELSGLVELSARGFRHGMDIGVAVDSYPKLDFARISGRPEGDFRGIWRRVVVNDEVNGLNLFFVQKLEGCWNNRLVLFAIRGN